MTDGKDAIVLTWLHPSRLLALDDAIPIGARLVLAVAGAVPVSLIGLSAFDWLGLRTLTGLVLLPAVATRTREAGTRTRMTTTAATALSAGVVATFVYDLFRWSFLLVEWMERDPIPHIGTALGAEPGWTVGYLWRFGGNGGGLALVFLALGGSGVRAGIGHGLLICSGLLAVLAWSPNGQEMLFPFDLATVVMATVGHVVYGAVLGLSADRLAAASATRRSLEPSR